MGIVAVTSLGGSQAAKQTDWTPLSGYKRVYLLPDNDKPGEHYMKDVYGALVALETPPQIEVLRLPGLPDKGDIVDWIQSLINDWDGYSPIDESLHKPFKARTTGRAEKRRTCTGRMEFSRFNYGRFGLGKAQRNRQQNACGPGFKSRINT